MPLCLCLYRDNYEMRKRITSCIYRRAYIFKSQELTSRLNNRPACCCCGLVVDLKWPTCLLTFAPRTSPNGVATVDGRLHPLHSATCPILLDHFTAFPGRRPPPLFAYCQSIESSLSLVQSLVSLLLAAATGPWLPCWLLLGVPAKV